MSLYSRTVAETGPDYVWPQPEVKDPALEKLAIQAVLALPDLPAFVKRKGVKFEVKTHRATKTPSLGVVALVKALKAGGHSWRITNLGEPSQSVMEW